MKVCFVLAAVLIAAPACSSGSDVSDVSDQAGPGADTPQAPRTDCWGESSGPDGCAPIPQPDSQSPDVWDLAPDMVAGVSGSVVDEAGKPISGMFVQPCVYTETTESCLKAISKDDGTWEVAVNPPRTIEGLHVRFVTNDYSAMACYYDFAELPLENNIVHFEAPYKLYSMGELVEELDVPPVGPVTVEAEGLSFTVLPEEWFPGVFEPTSIKIRKLPVEFAGCFAGPGDEPDVLYALSPDWLGFSTVGGVPVTFDNELGLTAGASVTLYFLGALDATVRPIGGEPILLKTGQWYKLGQGTVSSDGKSIVSDEGAGLPWLGVVGYRK